MFSYKSSSSASKKNNTSSKSSSQYKSYTISQLIGFMDDLTDYINPIGLTEKKSGEEFIIRHKELSDFQGCRLSDFLQLSMCDIFPASFMFERFLSAIQVALRNAAPQQLEWEKKQLTESMKSFFGNFSYEEIKQLGSPQFIRKIVMQLIPKEKSIYDYVDSSLYSLLPNLPTPSFVQGYQIECANKYCEIPKVLLKEVDLKAAMELSSYDSNDPIEGYWADPDEEILTLAGNKNVPLSNIRASILNKKEKNNSNWRYPVPCETPWPGKTEFLECLHALEEISRNVDKKIMVENKKMILNLFKDSSDKTKKRAGVFLNMLLSGNVEARQPHGPAAERLPLENKGSTETVIKLKNGKILAWTAAYGEYVKNYNIVPSRNFLVLFQAMLKDCREFYSEHAVKFKEMLSQLNLSEDKSAEGSVKPTSTLNSDDVSQNLSRLSLNNPCLPLYTSQLASSNVNNYIDLTVDESPIAESNKEQKSEEYKIDPRKNPKKR